MEETCFKEDFRPNMPLDESSLNETNSEETPWHLEVRSAKDTSHLEFLQAIAARCTKEALRGYLWRVCAAIYYKVLLPDIR